MIMLVQSGVQAFEFRSYEMVFLPEGVTLR